MPLFIEHGFTLMLSHADLHISCRMVKLLSLCQADSGGYAGGPGQLPHLAPTYAAVMTLCIIGSEEAFTSINRHSLSLFLTRMHQPDGSFIMHEGGEVDIR